MSSHQLGAALGAFLIQGLLSLDRHFPLGLYDLPGVLAFRVSGTSQKLPITSSSEDHGPATLLAQFLFQLARIFLIQRRALFREFPGILAFGVIAAGYEPSKPAPADHHFPSAFLALNARRDLFLFQIFHLFAGLLELFGELGIEFP